MKMYKELPLMYFKDKKAWFDWLEENHENQQGIWIMFAKKGNTEPTITYKEAREGALIYGWIDGLANGYDEKYHLLRFTPRRAKSIWSKINCKLALANCRET